MTVVYLDCVFLLNTVMDYLLCLVTARLAGIPLRRIRYLLSALVGGFYAVIACLPGYEFLTTAPVKIAISIFIVLIAYGGEEKLLRLSILFFTVSCALAGGVLALEFTGAMSIIAGIFYSDVDLKILVLAAIGAYLFLAVLFRAAAQQGIQGKLLTARICVSGRSVEVRTLWDTGNSLRDPIDGQPILVAALNELKELLPKEAQTVVTAESLAFPAEILESLRNAAPNLRPLLVSYRAVGVPSGMLLTIRADWLEICGVHYPNVLVALAPTTLGTGYAALWGGDLKRRERHENPGKRLAMDAKTTGSNANHSLHWRQRHASTSSDKRTRGGTSGSYP